MNFAVRVGLITARYSQPYLSSDASGNNQYTQRELQWEITTYSNTTGLLIAFRTNKISTEFQTRCTKWANWHHVCGLNKNNSSNDYSSTFGLSSKIRHTGWKLIELSFCWHHWKYRLYPFSLGNTIYWHQMSYFGANIAKMYSIWLISTVKTHAIARVLTLRINSFVNSWRSNVMGPYYKTLKISKSVNIRCSKIRYKQSDKIDTIKYIVNQCWFCLSNGTHDAIHCSSVFPWLLIAWLCSGYCMLRTFNALSFCDAIDCHMPGSKLNQVVIAACSAPSNFLIQCWLIGNRATRPLCNIYIARPVQ